MDGPAYHHSILLPLPPLDWKRVCVGSVRVVRFGQLVMFSRYKHHTQILGTHTFLAGAVLTSSLFFVCPGGRPQHSSSSSCVSPEASLGSTCACRAVMASSLFTGKPGPPPQHSSSSFDAGSFLASSWIQIFISLFPSRHLGWNGQVVWNAL